MRPEIPTTGSNSFPHFAQRVMRSITDTPTGTPTFAPNAKPECLFHSRVEIGDLPRPFRAPLDRNAGESADLLAHPQALGREALSLAAIA